MRILSTMPIEREQLDLVRAVNPRAEMKVVEDFTAYDPEVEILVAYFAKITEETLELYPRLRWIQVMHAGVDNLPWEAIMRQGILVTNARGAHKIQMSEHVIWSILTLLRQGKLFVQQQEKEVWEPAFDLEEMYGKTICLVGAGSIADAIAFKCKAFGMRVLGVSQSGKPKGNYDQVGTTADMMALLGQSDMTVVLLPLTEQTTGLFDKHLFAAMKRGSYFINVARGPVVDEKALLEALDAGIVRAAALDVFQEEPLPPGNPLWQKPNVFITPHIAGKSKFYMLRTFNEIFVENLKVYPHLSQMFNVIEFSKRY